ncbi:MAG TPA: bifunctional glycosyltransferase/class I SAM-dependent methyltransferase [Candidatus Dormibacteraeota bacterium]|nr:bifunctional glycosyltransferase/class I SAM-dependent methyltransferase [Candidatus Dormibacteraeota bacterium]
MVAMQGKLSLSILVPVYNEQYLVEASLTRLAALADSPDLGRVRVIVVNDASKDGTAAALERFRGNLDQPGLKNFEWIFLEHAKNQGKGAAIRTAIAHVDTDLVVMHDADLEYHPGDIAKMVPLFVQEDADAVFGSRFLSSDFRRVLLFRHSLGNRLITLLTNIVTDLNLSDIETCYKMVRADIFKGIPWESDRFGIEPEITVKLAKRKARIFEVPIRYSGRTYAEGKKITWKDGVRALGALVKYGISDKIYVADAYGSEILARLNRAPRFTRWMADTIRPYVGERVLEIGAGIGNLTANLVPRARYHASDINPHYLDRLETLKQTRPYLQVHYTDASAAETYPTEQFDTVICMNVVEHLANDVEALSNIRRSLDKNGRAIVLVPNGPRLFGSLDKVLGHYRRYTQEQLVQVCQDAGFSVEKVVKFNRFGTPGWWLNGRILKKETFGFWQIKLLNILVPFVRPIDRFLPFPHLSWIIILRAGPQACDDPGNGQTGA